MPEEKKDFGPDIKFDGDSGEFWAEISAADATGVAVAGVKAGDEIRILDISGLCAFEGGDDKKGASSLIGTVAEAATGPWAVAVKALREVVPLLAGGDKRRDGYGQEPGTTQFHTDEGGIILCFPGAGGVTYSNKDTRPVIKNDGRHPRTEAGKFHFPIRGDGGPIKVPEPTPTPGTLRIAAFDHKYTDNSGVYEVVFTITRPKKSPDEETR